MKRREFLDRVKFGLAAAAMPLGRGRSPEGVLSACSEEASPSADPSSLSPSANVASAPVSGSRDPRIEVDLTALGWNLARVRDRAKVPVMAVVKGNAYGHGLVEVAKFLERQGAEALMAGKLDEAVRLKDNGLRRPVFNFGPCGPADATEIVGRGICQSVSSEEARSLAEAAAKAGRVAEVDIHVDTGLNRAGVPYSRAIPLIETIASLKTLRIKGISTALTEDPEFDAEQLRRFLEVCDAAKRRGITLGIRHVASSAALFEGAEFFLDMVRPGITLYGYYPNARTRKEDALGLKPVLKLKASVTFVNDLAAGETLSYLRAYKADTPMRVATLGIGYSDGYPVALGGTGVVVINGRKYPVLPAVTANHTMVNLGNDASVKVGDEAILIDDRRSSGVAADALSELCGVGDYKILIGLNPLVSRHYRSAGPASGSREI
ncbi:MAG: alanine racemase [Candidatus Aminicenantes bacterium]|nr:alanine racemase [Candidatus Aminicenantes bacterium]